MKCAASVIFTLLLGLSQAALAMDPPEGGFPVSRGRGVHIAPEAGAGNIQFSPELVAGLRSRLAGNRGPNLMQFGSKGLPAAGSPRVLVLLIDFDEYPARPGDTPEALRERIFGAGGEFPYESLSAYYRRASLGKLRLDGDVLGWYHAGKRADVPQTWAGREELIKRALLSFKDHDFSQYDSNGDGVIDYFAVIWTGPLGDWATFWWGLQMNFSDKAFTVGGKTLNTFSWQGVVNRWDDPSAAFKINTLIHETGHALGLPDYYDYKPEVGPKGGLGGFDMMDSTRYDHNCFSKMMLGWIEPRVVRAGGQFTLRPSEEAGDCVLLLPKGREQDPFGEFFLVETRRRVANDSERGLVSGGLVIWHVDARLNDAGTNFRYNNSTTDHKLLKILESDGQEGLDSGSSAFFGPGEFYLKDRALGPETTPSSRLYDGTDTGISLLSSGGDNEVNFSVGYR